MKLADPSKLTSKFEVTVTSKFDVTLTAVVEYTDGRLCACVTLRSSYPTTPKQTGKKKMMKSGLMCTLISAICASAATADPVTFQCHPATQQRSTTDLELRLDKSTEKVTKFSFWDEIDTIFWSDELIYWVAKGNYSETSPQLALAGFNTSTSQLIVKTISAGSFEDDAIANITRRDIPPLNCYRVGL